MSTNSEPNEKPLEPLNEEAPADDDGDGGVPGKKPPVDGGE